MAKNILILFLILPLLFSCYNVNKQVIEKPDPFLSRESMVELLTDIQLAEGIIIYNRSNKVNNFDRYKDSLYSTIFRNHDVTYEIFKENINYYNTDPEFMEDIYEEVLTNLTKMKSEVEEVSKAKEEIADTTVIN